MVPDNDRASEFAHYLKALSRASVVPHYIACAQEVCYALCAAIVQDDVERVQIGVYVSQNCK